MSQFSIQQLKYVVAVAESGSITEAAKRLMISQPSLSEAIKQIEKKIGSPIFSRSRTGVTHTPTGQKFLGSARQVVAQMNLLEDQFIPNHTSKPRFCISTQHYTFTSNAFVDLINIYGYECYEYILNETETQQIIHDVHAGRSELGILYLSHENQTILQRIFAERGLEFVQLFTASPHVFLAQDHPLATQNQVSFTDLEPYPKISFTQGDFESLYLAEEPFSGHPVKHHVKVSDRGAIVNLMLGLQGYTISSGIFPKSLQGDAIIAIPLAEPGQMTIGYLKTAMSQLSACAKTYLELLSRYQNPSLPHRH